MKSCIPILPFSIRRLMNMFDATTNLCTLEKTFHLHRQISKTAFFRVAHLIPALFPLMRSKIVNSMDVTFMKWKLFPLIIKKIAILFFQIVAESRSFEKFLVKNRFYLL